MGALIHIENMTKIYNPGDNEVRTIWLQSWDIPDPGNQR